ncbi:hypothetical protein GCM10017781_21780 [Deinococcus metalli]|uniref:HNH endonuclease n=1 Tax=Deinococcus metalli TaxID=1141878 RepID=A0ABQ3JMA9_9DEIO|nr:hypothetical protein GCM10017781_21780 [Deinococcus metalli]
MGDLTCSEVPLVFVQALGENLFLLKNNATVERRLAHKRYQALHAVVSIKYPDDLQLPLGTCLHRLKVVNDPLYRRFLNPNGDGTFIRARSTTARGIRNRHLVGANCTHSPAWFTRAEGSEICGSAGTEHGALPGCLTKNYAPAQVAVNRRSWHDHEWVPTMLVLPLSDGE